MTDFGTVVKINNEEKSYVVFAKAGDYSQGYGVVPKSMDPECKYDYDEVTQYCEEHPDMVITEEEWRKDADTNNNQNSDVQLSKEDKVVALIRQRYSVNQELEIQRKRDTDPDAFNEYYAYVEECIKQVEGDSSSTDDSTI